jgi:hypothetical protein
LWREHILAALQPSDQCSVVFELKSRYLCAQLQVLLDVGADLLRDGPGFSDGLVDDYEGAGLGDFEVDALAIWGVSSAGSVLCR